jgi:hypothetical protein
LNVKCDFLVSKFAFIKVNLCRYAWEHDATPEWHLTLGFSPAKPEAKEKQEGGDGDDDDAELKSSESEDAGEPSVNELVVAEGFARVEKWAARKPAAKALVEVGLYPVNFTPFSRSFFHTLSILYKLNSVDP